MVGDELVIERRTENGKPVLSCTGEIYIATEEKFRQHLDEVISEGHGQFSIDLGGVHFLSSTFFNEVLRLIGAHPKVKITCLTRPEHDRIFKIVRFEKVVATTRAFTTS